MKNILMTLFLLNSTFVFSNTNRELLNNLVKNEKHGNIVKVYHLPTKINSLSLEYNIPEIILNPRDILYFYIPEKFKDMTLSWLGFSHRQDEENSTSRDLNPGLTSALVYSSSKPGDEFRHWGGPASGPLASKFAERGIYPEYDALYEWPLKGHRGFVNKKKSFELISPNVVRIQNVGTDLVHFSKLDLKINPSKYSIIKDSIFTKKSKFGAIETMKGRFYGGGQRLRGTFPNAIVLTAKSTPRQPKLPSNFRVLKNKLKIALIPNEKFSFIQIMCGDSYPDRIINRDGGYGTSGNARINISIKNRYSGKSRLLAKNINIPPEGIITSSALDEDTIVEAGDELIITNGVTKSPIYIMATRVGYLPF